ncbi:signal peptidase I [Brachybacterium sp. JHP9]|uniref:Signal peptidase I n=1 Tax=Brachybacterium equifaecis TaxID=2910770 RepID=A0ABT0QZH8_9MICO|nr:signal peptidase I [Brachybacterium equifaecis]MCL6422125.1 signal peptidase I [Brachybacterium equifaecis]
MSTDPVTSETAGAALSPERARGRRLLALAALATVLLLVAALGVRTFVTAPFRVPSASMEPTLQVGDVLLADRTAGGRAERGEIVVFDGSGYLPGTEDSPFFVKRVIAVGGDTIRCCDESGALVLNGVPLSEPYLAPGTAPSTIAFDLEVPRGRMFVMGDNRADSTDSRHLLGAPGGGMIPVERVTGEASRIVWPLERSGPLAPVESAR